MWSLCWFCSIFPFSNDFLFPAKKRMLRNSGGRWREVHQSSGKTHASSFTVSWEGTMFLCHNHFIRLQYILIFSSMVCNFIHHHL